LKGLLCKSALFAFCRRKKKWDKVPFDEKSALPLKLWKKKSFCKLTNIKEYDIMLYNQHGMLGIKIFLS